MNDWIQKRIEKAGWLRFLFWFGVNIAYSVWAFILPGPWTRMLEAMGVSNETAGAARLPELTFGFFAGMPAEAFEKLGAGVNGYALFQLIDVPYAVTGVAMTVAGIALGLKRFNLSGSALRFALFIPVFYLTAELVENPLLAAMALDVLPAEAIAAGVQQAATSLKFIADIAGTIALVVAVVASLGAVLTKPFRRGRRRKEGAYES